MDEEETTVPSKVQRLLDESSSRQHHHYAVVSVSHSTEECYPGESSKCVGEIIKQCNGYSPERPLNVTILAPGWSHFPYDISLLLSRELSIQLAVFPQVKVTALVPENACSISDKENAARHRVTIVEAKKQPGFDDPIHWLYFPPKDLTTDMIVGVGQRLGKIAQIFKERHQCRNIYVASNPYEDWLVGRQKLRERLAANRAIGLSLQRNVGLSEMADHAVAIGPKTSEELSCQYHKKEIFQLTPGILREFSDVKQATADRTKFRTLIFVDGNPKNFLQHRLDIAAEAVAELDDRSYQLLIVGATGKEKQYVKQFSDCGVAKSQLQFRSLPKSEEELKRLFCEADLAIMPSSEQGFQMVALAALSAGLPILVHGDSGFGEALTPVPGGTLSTVDSDDAKVWAKAIKKVRVIDRKIRLEEAAMLRSSYDEKYSWEKQCGELVKIMMDMASGVQQDLTK